MNIYTPSDHEGIQATSLADRAALVETVHRLLVKNSDETAIRRIMATERGYDTSLWQELAGVGITGLIIPVEDGGTGLRSVELELVSEEVGAALLCSPFLSSSVFGAALLQALDERRHLPAIAAGSLIVTVAVAGSRGTWTRDDVDVVATSATLSGTSRYVLDGQNADILLVVARAKEDEIEIFEVPAASPGVTIEPLQTFDQTRRLAHVHFNGAKGRLIGNGWQAVEQALNVARIALAGEQAGGGREIFNRTVEYAKQRFQFGRAIGGFQAIKHMAADLFLESESSLSAARNAAEQFDKGPGHDTQAIPLAGFACADAFVKIAADAIQMHGGIGFTWEHPAHLFLRRARSNAQLFGPSAQYREWFLQALGG